MYRWRKLTPEQQRETLAERRLHKRPWHSPRHFKDGSGSYLVTSTCYEHRSFIGRSDERMRWFSDELRNSIEHVIIRLDAWVVLPNHYHLLVITESCGSLLKSLGRFHGRTSRKWNLEDDTLGRKVWFNTLERKIEGDRHFVTALQYVHHNPVKHGHATTWRDWEWSSAKEYLERVGREEAERRWREYPVRNYGDGWDD